MGAFLWARYPCRTLGYDKGLFVALAHDGSRQADAEGGKLRNDKDTTFVMRWGPADVVLSLKEHQSCVLLDNVCRGVRTESRMSPPRASSPGRASRNVRPKAS